MVRHMWEQLRWRLVGSQMLVVLVGVLVLALSARWALRALPAQVEDALQLLAPAATADALGTTTATVTQAMQNVLLQSLLIAAVAATLAGLLASVLLIRQILRPLYDVAHSSQRIADGHYDERVRVPPVEELALVANNFNQMAESLGDVEAQRVQMIGNVSHELRTPLTGLRGYLEGLLDGLFPSNSETFGHMYQEVRRMQRLVDDLQAISRVEAGQFDLDIQNFDLIPVVQRVVGQMQPQVQVDGIELSTDLPDALDVYADVDRTAQVLVNLLSNANRYTNEGGEIMVTVRTTERFAIVDVRDTGIGLSTDDQQHIFDRFYRADPSRARGSAQDVGGSGIGLTIARHFSWAMGGSLSVQSEGIGTGSLFTLSLPLR